MRACHERLVIGVWKSSTARSSAAARSHIQAVLGESSNRITSRVEDASKSIKEQPVLVSGPSLAPLPAGDTPWVALVKV